MGSGGVSSPAPTTTALHYSTTTRSSAPTRQNMYTRMPEPFFVVVVAFKDRNRSILIGPLGIRQAAGARDFHEVVNPVAMKTKTA